MHQPFDQLENVFLFDKAHFHVELIEFARGAVRPRIFVAETGGNLEITVETGYHQQLFELLRSLRQRIKFTGMQAARDQVVTGAFRGAGGKDGGLEFMEAVCPHVLAHSGDYIAAEDDIFLELVAAEVEEAIFEAHGFRGHVVFCHLERNDFGFAEDFHFIGNQFDFTGWNLGIDIFRGAFDELAGECDHAFHAPAFQRLVKCLFRIDHHLGDSVMVAQIDEDYAAVVADAMDPAGQFYRFSDIAFAQFSTSMGSEFTHKFCLS